MEYYIFNSIEAQKILKPLILSKTLIPILGSGFSVGCISKAGIVPDGDQLKEIMINAILNNTTEFQAEKEELEASNFQEISQIFLDEEIVPKQIVKDILKNNFTRVQLDDPRIKFLNSFWPYLYTLNIDDAIETNSKFIPVLPYKAIAESSKDLECLYKIHGDARHEVIYDEPSSLVFSTAQYIKGLYTNDFMLNFLKNEIIDRNLIFIGCSLRDEIDLMFAIAGSEENPITDTYRIYVTRSKPSKIKETKLKQYKINIVLIVEDYNAFYNDINKIASESEFETIDVYSKYLVDNIYKLPQNKDDNLNYLLKSDKAILEKNHKQLPYFFIEREIKQILIKSIMDNPVTVLKGRRYSGKTNLLLDIASSIRSKKVYYFSSTMSISKELILKLIKQNDSIFIFDSNVLDFEKAFEIRKMLPTINTNNSSILICCNPLEIDIANTFAQICGDYAFFELNNKFSEGETLKLNQKLNQLGLINFKQDKNILDNTYFLQKQYPDINTGLFQIDGISSSEIKALIILASLDKSYSIVTRELGFSFEDTLSFVQKYHPLLELEKTEELELHHHSGYKIVLNSKPWAFKIINEYHNQFKDEQVINEVSELVSLFYRNQKYKYISEKIVMFDNLNQLFGQQKGAGYLIFNLYSKLQGIFSDNSDYWLQRAKATLKLKTSEEKVTDGIHYAKKAYNDFKREKTQKNAELTTALLYGKLCKMQNYKNESNLLEAIEWFYNALNNHSFNKNYIDSLLEASRGKRGYFYDLCNYLMTGENKHPSLLTKYEKVKFLTSYANSIEFGA